MKYIILIVSIFCFSIDNYSIQIFPSGIKVDFTSPDKVTKNTILLQTEEATKQKSPDTHRVIRIINSIRDIPSQEYLALIFYNKKKKIIGHRIISNSQKPLPDHIFFIDRDTGRNFQGFIDIYRIPKQTVSFALAFIDKKGKVILQNFKHPDFDENQHISLEQLFAISPEKNIMLQYEIVGNYQNPAIKLAAFHFVP
ncbi:MAG: hypothetical protein ACRC0X_03645 [Brevinema sp.]